MRFKSKKTNGFTVYSVTGVNTVSFAIIFEPSKAEGLLGFAVERESPKENEKYFMYNSKVFESIIPEPDETTQVTSFDHPIQSFVWDDFTAKPEHEYIYRLYPIKGEPKNLDRSLKPMVLKVRTEALYDDNNQHQIFFNRGVMSSQAYTRRFSNKKPSDLPEPLKTEAFKWLSRDLLSGFENFIKQAEAGGKIYGCFYEFRYKPALQYFKDAIDRGVQIEIIIDGKNNKTRFPVDESVRAAKEVGIENHLVLRQAKPSYIQHNKFMVYVTPTGVPKSVWTGSTNISEGGIFGHTNVGHWINDDTTASNYKRYWDILKLDGDDLKELRNDVEAIQPNLKLADVSALPKGITTIFSPRKNSEMLNLWGELLDSSTNLGAITLAFGVNAIFKDKLLDNKPANSPLIYLLLEKEDKATTANASTFKKLTARHNVYTSFGSYLKDKLNQWSKETNQQITKLNGHVTYVHSKFLLCDPLGEFPIVVTGSANFSKNSTIYNDENMVIIKGDTRAADIYFTEFNRLFNHYYFRSVYNKTLAQNRASTSETIFLSPDDSWLKKYETGTLRYKKLQIFKKMHIE